MSAPATELPNAKRRRAFAILGAIIVVVALGATIYWWAFVRHYESTDDAYVASDIVQITSEIAGTVLAVRVDDTQAVKQGDVLVTLDPADARIAVAAAEADLAQAVRRVRGLYSQADQLRAQIAERSTELQQAQDDYSRREGLLADGAVSSEEIAHTRDTVARVRSALEAARQQLDTTLARIEGTTVATHPEVLAAAAKYRDAALALHRTTIVAPVSGVVAKRGVQLGQRVAAGAPLMALVPLDDVWIDANFKEGQLKDVRIGQPVTVRADLYGDRVEYHGKVVGVSAGSGSAFALLPSQNASGNWIKIVQRLPVRIALNRDDLKQHPLRVGLSMRAKIDVSNTSGSLIADQVRTTPQVASDNADLDPSIDQRVAEIIRQNLATATVARTNKNPTRTHGVEQRRAAMRDVAAIKSAP